MVTASTEPPCCSCGDEPASLKDSWSGEPVGEDCASWGPYKTDPLTLDDVVHKLLVAVAPPALQDDNESQADAVLLVASLLMHQQRRIAELEAAVAKLTKEDS